MTRPRKLLGGGQSGWPRAHDGDLLAGLVLGDLRLNPAHLPGFIHDGALDGLDGHRLISEVEGAGGFTRGRADATSEFRKVVGAVQDFDGFTPVAVIDEVIPVRNDIVHRTAIVAIGDAAIHAARALTSEFFLGKWNDEFLIIPYPVGNQSVASVLTRDFHETRGFAHAKLTSL